MTQIHDWTSKCCHSHAADPSPLRLTTFSAMALEPQQLMKSKRPNDSNPAQAGQLSLGNGRFWARSHNGAAL